MRRIFWGAGCGVLAAGFGVAVAELLAAATRPQAGPLVAVGGAIIDATPTPVKEFAVRELGTNDKPVLLGSIGLVLILFTAVVGALAVRHRAVAVAGALVFGAAGVSAALSRPSAAVFDVVPSLLAAMVAGAVLLWLLHLLAPVSGSRRVVAEQPRMELVMSPTLRPGESRAGVPVGPGAAGGDGVAVPPEVDRRKFLLAAGLVVAAGAAIEGGAQVVKRTRGGAIARSRSSIRLPAAADPAPPLPAGVGAGFITANRDFYRVDTALSVPRIDVSTWSLRIHGMVGDTAELSFADLLNRPLIERDITLNCVSNEVGGPYIGTARWLGVPLAPLLKELGVKNGADQIVARSVDGMTIGTPVVDSRDAILCVGMNGEPLPLEHGFPVRMLTPGLYGYAGACKWLTDIELTTFDAFDAYWVKRGWGRRGLVKTASRIDKPQPFAQLTAGSVTVAGVAWAQERGIKSVEVRADDGPWVNAELLPTASTNTWVQWRHSWTAAKGPHTLAVRATDATGAVQTSQRVTPFPDGATGWHAITVTVG
jgi:DMSO/TMAO reductase YedYZ molybdopterin-dependent catalytic subunit